MKVVAARYTGTSPMADQAALARTARICRALNDAGARYVLIGGFAVLAHGASRFIKDIDLLR